MLYITLLEWQHVGPLSVADKPVSVNGDMVVFKLLSRVETIKVVVCGVPFREYKHVALKKNIAYVFDVAAQEIVMRLGPVTTSPITSVT